MQNNANRVKLNIWEAVFHLVLLVLVFIFYSFDRDDRTISSFEIGIFLSYVVAAYTINYFLLPRFLYKKKYVHFTVYVVLVIAAVIYIEEGVLEKIYFPDTRALRFPGVFFNLVSALPTIVILTGFKFAWDALTKERQLEELKTAARESELLYLKSQINPHFLFNNLNNLYAHALESSPKTPEIILELSSVLRYMLYECQERYVPLHKEIDQLKSFVELSKLQLEDRGTVKLNFDEVPEHFQIAPLILPVFVENAFKHSLSSVNKDIEIKIDLSLDHNGKLHFNCQNSFSLETNTGDLSKGIGLANVRKRLELLYPESHELQIKANGDIYEVNLEIDLTNSDLV